MPLNSAAQNRSGSTIYAVTWTLSELEMPSSRYMDVLAPPEPVGAAAESYRHVRSYPDGNAIGVYLRIPAADLATAIEIGRARVFGSLERAGLRPPRSVMMVASCYSMTL
jgi:hypothetical protein